MLLRHYLFLFIVTPFLYACQPSSKQATAESTLPQRLDSLFGTVPDFSGVALVADEGKPVYYKAFGYQNFDTGTAMDTAALFELASLSKPFTAMIIMMLQEEGKLAFDDPVERFLPDLPYDGITIRHLLQHTSGLPDYQAIMEAHWDKSRVAGNEEILAYLKRYHPPKQFEPGTQYEYSNTGYVLLASIAEKASGEDFIRLCRDNIFHPLSMRQTDIRNLEDKEKRENMAWGYLYVPEQTRYVRADSFPASNYTLWLGQRKGPGRVSATAGDLLRWDQALYTTQLVNRETLEAAFSPALLKDGSLSHYGFGWEIASDAVLGKVVRHSGDNPGYKNHIIRYVEAHKTIILLCNNAHATFEEVLKGMEQLVAQQAKGV